MKVFYITDYAPYSSDTCKNCKGSREMKKLLLQRTIHNTYFDPMHFNVTLDKGFAAAVESQFLASANFLFLCGGGGYQSQIAARFTSLQQRKNMDYRQKNIFRVCIDDADVSRLLRQSLTPGT